MNSALRSWRIYLGLTLASALAAHLIFDAVDDGLLAIVTRPIHVLYGAVVALAFVATARDLYAHGGAERRRRIALMQCALRDRGSTPLGASLAAQAVLAAATLRLEHTVVDPAHIAVAAICAAVALVAGALLLRRIESGLLRFVRAVFAARRPRALVRRDSDAPLLPAVRAERAYGLFRPNRPPPLFA